MKSTKKIIIQILLCRLKKNMKDSKRKIPNNVKRKPYQNNTSLFSREPKQLKSTERYSIDQETTDAGTAYYRKQNFPPQEKAHFKQYLPTNPVIQNMSEGKLHPTEVNYIKKIHKE